MLKKRMCIDPILFFRSPDKGNGRPAEVECLLPVANNHLWGIGIEHIIVLAKGFNQRCNLNTLIAEWLKNQS